MQERRFALPRRAICAALLAFIGCFAATSLHGQPQDESRTTDAGQAMPANIRARLQQFEEILKQAQADGDRTREAAALIYIGEV